MIDALEVLMPNRVASRPGLAIIANCMTPYRAHLHRLVFEGIPEFQLHSLITHDAAEFKWAIEAPENLNIHRFGRAGDSPLASTFSDPINEWKKGWRIANHIRRHNVQAVIINGYRYLSYLCVIRYCHRNRIPLFVSNDSNLRSERRLPLGSQLLKRQVYRWWMRRVNGWMPMGKLGDEFFLKYGADRNRLYRLPCIPDYAAFETASPAGVQRFRHAHGLSEKRKLLIYSGRLVPVKRVDLLIEAFLQLAIERPDWDLLIVGDGMLRTKLAQQVPENFRHRVIWTGFLEQNELANAYHASDVLVLPSDREPWAVVVQEAMAAGLTVVASDVVGAAHELITDGVNGRIFAAGDSSELLNVLLDITRSDQLPAYKRESKAALQRWRTFINPISEIRRALSDAGALPRPPAAHNVDSK